MEAFEYAIKKDIRNNPIVREVDHARVKEMWRSASVGALLVAILLFSAWQHFELIRYGYRIEQLASGKLKMVPPTAADTYIIERVVPSEAPATSVVASR